MGIRGLTGYMSDNQFLENYKLQNCNVIIDGKNLAHSLHNECTGINVAFGGDFDKYANFVRKYFEGLQSCGVHALVVMDGAHPLYNKKLKTAQERAVAQIVSGLSVTPENQFVNKIFPPMCLQVFVTTLQNMGVLVLQSDYEADDDISSLARQLNSVVISQDSDFYMANVPYVPLSSISYKNISPQKHIRCSIFKTEKFCERTGVNPLHLPLLGSLMVNGYITDEELAHFHKKIAWQMEKRRVSTPYGRRELIRWVIKWMAYQKNKTLDEVINKVADQSKRLKKRLLVAISGYILPRSRLLDCIPYIVHTKSTEKGIIHEDTGECVKYVFDVREVSKLQRSSHLGTDLVLRSCDKPPDWFVKAYRENRIPREVSNILTHRYFFSPAQVECLDSESSYLVVEPIIRSIYVYLKKECLAEVENSQENEEYITSEDIEEDFEQDQNLGIAHKDIESSVYDVENPAGFESENYDFSNEGGGDFDVVIEEEGENDLSVPVELNIVEEDEGEDNDTSEALEGSEKESAIGQLISAKSPLKNTGLLQDMSNSSKCSTDACIGNQSDMKAKSRMCNAARETEAPVSQSKKKKKQSKKNLLRWYIRQRKSLWCKNLKYQEAVLGDQLPSLNEVEFLPLAAKRLVFYRMLKMESKFKDHDIPVDLELILNCIIYWYRNTRENLNDCHVLTALVCIFMYYIIDSKIGSVRTLQGFENAKSCQEKVSDLLKDPVYSKADASEFQLLVNMTNDECLVAGSNLFLYHHLDKAVRGKIYKRKVVHAFSEYQSCIYFVQLLNNLLCLPFPFLCIENLWGGTFGYNIYMELSQTSNRQAKMTYFFGEGTCLQRLFSKLFIKLEEVLQFSKTSVRKSLKKIGKKKVTEHKKRIKQWEQSKVRKNDEKPEKDITKDKIEKDLEHLLDNRFAGMLIESESEHDDDISE